VFVSNLADELWYHVWSVAELSKHLQVTDAANRISKITQPLRAQHMQSLICPHILKLEQKINIHSLEKLTDTNLYC